MILVKDNRPKAHWKLFPVYFKCPEKVINECYLYKRLV